MQFILRGPDIPERLLQAHEEGKVVFFCGAGISYPARLPGFSGLVKKLFEVLSITPDSVQQVSIKAGHFDTAIGLLEANIVGGRETVRRALAEILTPDLNAKNATTTHEALLTLAQNRTGNTRIITTNFDRLFEEVKIAKSLSFPEFKAPLLPVPKARWDGLVYLHGLLPNTPTTNDLDRLVASSGDFGLAYLTERWAARFVSELFRNFTICFVGYSINDPVLRYMMDALAADRLLGETPPEMFAFGSYSKGKEIECASEWQAKNVTPILYREHKNHLYLHQTLRAWAETYRDGVRGKERIVTECALARPQASTKQDDFVGRMLWALSDPCGLPAKHFAELDPVPSLDWLEPLSQDLYGHADLGRFGVSPEITVDVDLTYSMTNRPTPYKLSQRMAIVSAGSRSNDLDVVMHQLARWLVRHLNDPTLLIWVVNHGGKLHQRLISLIEDHLDKLDRLTNTNQAELNDICTNAPNAIPDPTTRTLWRLILNGHVKSKQSGLSLYSWGAQLKRYGFTTSVRLALRKTLTPCLSLREAFKLHETDNDETPDHISKIVEPEVDLASDDVHSGLRSIAKNEQWMKALPQLLDEFSALLRDALDLMHEIGHIDNESDRTYLYQPSIADHPQNKDYHNWTALIELTRDAWIATSASLPDRARIAAEMWIYHGEYPVFQRLALFAAAQNSVIPPHQALDWLLSDNKRWLWSKETKRETIRLLVSLAPQLNAAMMSKLEQAILAGPPRNLYPTEMDQDDWKNFVDRSTWLRLAKIAQTDALLGEEVRLHLNSLSIKYSWELAKDERDEFLFWSGISVRKGHSSEKFTPVPRTRRGVLNYLLDNPTLEDDQQDDWRSLCSEMFQATAYALCKLSKQKSWPVERWRDALQAWGEEEHRNRSWLLMAPVIIGADNKLVNALSRSISWWLQSVAKTFEDHEEYFFSLSQRILHLDFEDESNADDPVFKAINHPVGHVTQALLDWFYRQIPDDGQGLPESIKPIFTELCDTKISKYKHGRVLLAANVISLFRVDKVWSEQNLLPLFDWHRSEIEAQGAWEGFLWSPRLYLPLMEAIKLFFLDTANHYIKLGKHKSQFAALLTFAALDSGNIFTKPELANAIQALPAEGLHKSARTLVRALESAGDQREDYWRNRILPFWEKIWPKSNAHISSTNSESLARLCIAAGGEFPSAIATIGNWLCPIKNPDYVIDQLQESNMPTRYPEEVLQLLFLLLDNKTSWPPPTLRECLDEISKIAPNLCGDHKFMKINELARKA